MNLHKYTVTYVLLHIAVILVSIFIGYEMNTIWTKYELNSFRAMTSGGTVYACQEK